MCENKEILLKCTKKNTPLFTMEDNEYFCKCVDVYDGDTITVAFKRSNEELIYKHKIRLLGIDTPEVRTKNLEEKKKGIEIRDILREKILNKIIFIKCGKFDKYGRLLAYVYDEDKKINFNKWLIDQGFAYEYNGGTKKIYK
jgi:micrococcal nuclease